MSITTLIIIIQYAAIAVLFAELVYAICQKPSEMQKHIIVLTVATIIMFVGYIIEINATNYNEAYAGIIFSYVGKPFVMVSTFLFICSFYGRKIKNKYIIAMTIWAASFPVVVYTNEYHHLYYKTVGYNLQETYSAFTMTKGIYYYAYMVSAIAFFIGCIWVIREGYTKSKRKYNRPLALYSILMVVSGIMGYLVYIAGVTNGYDSTMLGVFGGAIFLGVLFIKCKVFDPLDIAKDHALEDSSMALLVFDENGEVIYKNSFMNKILKVIPLATLKSMHERELNYSVNKKTYAIENKALTYENMNLGRSVEITDITAAVDAQAVLEEEVKERTERIEVIQRSIIGAVANIVEARSLETGEHIKRTSEIAEKIAIKLKAMGFYKKILSEEYIKTLAAATPLHDVGKIVVSDVILMKPGRLTTDEFEKMKIHTTAGAEIIEKTMRGLESDEYVDMAEDIARYHHEQWNGSGYPENLMGEEIPLSARIVAVADCYDALISERCYKPPYSLEEALEILRQESWNHFDPCVFEAFTQILKEEKGVF